MGRLYGRAGRLTTENGGFRPGQWPPKRTRRHERRCGTPDVEALAELLGATLSGRGLEADRGRAQTAASPRAKPGSGGKLEWNTANRQPISYRRLPPAAITAQLSSKNSFPRPRTDLVDGMFASSS
jgi:hypothetical protein